MPLVLTVTAGPHLGKEFRFDAHDTFLVGRVEEAHLRLSYDDPYFSRRHFMIEVNPPRCRVIDLKSRNGTMVNGKKVVTADINDGDEISAGHTTFKVSVRHPKSMPEVTLDDYRPRLEDVPPVTLAQELPAPLTPASTVAHKPPATTPSTSTTGGPAVLTIPGYRDVTPIGQGGMGTVYRAKRERDGLPVAIKTITPTVGVSRKQVDRFMRECRILGELDHPNIVGFHGVEEVGGTICLIMELVNGADASKLLADRGPLKVKTAVRLICQVLGGLAYAHEKGFVHRDIKPANILIHETPDGKKVAKLADFGLARVYEASKLSGITMTGEIGGTLAYMAPEQVTHFRECKPASDQYSIAVTLYKLLTDKYTHDFPREASSAEVMIHIVTESPIPIRERRADIPDELAAAIHRALAREAQDRFDCVDKLKYTLYYNA